jgi:hypothetical protein
MHQKKYKVTEDWVGDFYCRIKLNWDYTAHTLNISMPGYIKKMLHKYKHCIPSKPQCCPHYPAPQQFGGKAQAPLPIDISLKLLPDDIKQIQHIIGSIFCYAWPVGITVLMALSSIAIKQTNARWKKPSSSLTI